MKKIILLLFLFISILLGSCQNGITTENPNISIIDEYSAFLENDIVTADQFITVMNFFTNELMPAVFDIRSELRDSKSFEIIDTVVGSGVILSTKGPYIIVLTSSSIVQQVGENIVSYHVTDRNGNERIGTLTKSSESLGLALVQFYSPPGYTTYSSFRFSNRQVYLNEPIVLLGFQYGIKNAMTMGIITDVNKEDLTFKTSLVTDQAGLGGALFDLSGALIGMQTHYNQETNIFEIATIRDIVQFLEAETESTE